MFGETLVFRRLLDEAPSPASRLSLLAESIEGSIATVFRQIAMNRFEHAVHTTRRDEGELSVQRFNDLWEQSQTDMLGDSVEVTDGYRSWWSYVPHFIGSPGYVYAYAYGQLLALSIYQRYEDEGRASYPPTWSCSARGAPRLPRSWRPSPASISPTRASGSRGSISSSASSARRRRRPTRCLPGHTRLEAVGPARAAESNCYSVPRGDSQRLS